jgi:hypothetical protein
MGLLRSQLLRERLSLQRHQPVTGSRRFAFGVYDSPYHPQKH